MTAYWFLPAWFGLIGAGWLLREHRDRIIRWLGQILDAPDAGIALHPAMRQGRHLRVVRRPFDFERDGGDAA